MLTTSRIQRSGLIFWRISCKPSEVFNTKWKPEHKRIMLTVKAPCIGVNAKLFEKSIALWIC